MRAFMSYQTTDKLVAGRVAKLVVSMGCTAFMAHEDIAVSEEWRVKILKELGEADIFVPILSAHFYGSIWCKQESGIAAFRNMTIIPLSIDGAIPGGFISHIQSTYINQEAPKLAALLPGLAKWDVGFVIGGLISIIGKSGNYRSAEANFELILPYIQKASDEQIVELLNASTANNQVCNAGLCATKYLPPIFATHGKLMDEKTRKELGDVLKRYEPYEKKK